MQTQPMERNRRPSKLAIQLSSLRLDVLLLDLPRDLLSEVLVQLGPASFRAVAPVCALLRDLTAEKLAFWRARAQLLCALDLTELPIPASCSCLPLAKLQYEGVGVRLRGDAAGVLTGISGGDPGNWQLEGTVRGVPGGGRFIGFNTNKQSLQLSFRHPVTSVAFDLVTRDAACEVAIHATAADGSVLHAHTMSVGPATSSWVTLASVEHSMAAYEARAVATTHCTAVKLARSGGSDMDTGRVATFLPRSPTRDELALSLRPDEEIAAVTVTFHDRARVKDDERAIGLANIRLGL